MRITLLGTAYGVLPQLLHVKQAVNGFACRCGFVNKLSCGRLTKKSELCLALQQQRIDTLRIVGILYRQFSFFRNVAVADLFDACMSKHLVKYVLGHLSQTDTVQNLSFKRIEIGYFFRTHNVQQTVCVDTEQHVVAFCSVVNRRCRIGGKHGQFQFALGLGSLCNYVLRILCNLYFRRYVADFTVGNDFCNRHCRCAVGRVQRHAYRIGVVVRQVVGLTRNKRKDHCRDKNNQSDYRK